MELKVTSELGKLEGQLKDALQSVESGQVEGLDAAGDALLKAKVAEIEKGTYARPARRLKSGKPAYERTESWRNSQRLRRRGDGEVEVYTEGRAAEYEPYLADLPTGPDGVNRSNDAVGKVEAIAEELARKAIEDELEAQLSRL